MSNEIMLQPPSELIKVVQLPVIEQQLQVISENMQAQRDEALALEATEENVAQVRAKRAELNRTFKDLEERRIAVKKAIMAPYDEFEAVYKKHITDIHKPTDDKLKSRIENVDKELIGKKITELEEHFADVVEETKVDFVTFDGLKLNVTRSASMNKLKNEISDELNRIAGDVAVIGTLEHSSEVLVEYKQNLDLTKAVLEVNKRKELLAEELKRQEELEAQKKVAAEAKKQAAQVAMVEFTPPTPASYVEVDVPEEESAPFEPMAWELVDDTDEPIAETVEVTEITVKATSEDQIKLVTELCERLGMEYSILTKEVI